MTDEFDLPSLLRQKDKQFNEPLFSYAASRIETLDKEVSRWRFIAERFVESDPLFDAKHAYFKEVFHD